MEYIFLVIDKAKLRREAVQMTRRFARFGGRIARFAGAAFRRTAGFAFFCPMFDIYKYREYTALTVALFVAGLETLRNWSVGGLNDWTNMAVDCGAMVVYNWLILRFIFFMDDYQQRKGVLLANRRLFVFRALLIFTVGTAIVLAVESLFHYFFRDREDPVIRFYFSRGIFHNALILTVYIALRLQQNNRIMAVENALLKEQNLLAQLTLLRQQVNPHFLFNALNTLKSMVRTGEPQASEFIVHLSEVYRYLLQSNLKELVPVREEVDMLHAYAFLLQTRFGDNFHLHIDLPAAILDSRVPTLTLQILLENAVKHNVVSKDKPLQVRIFSPGDQTIIVQNNLNPKQSPEPGTGTGLENVVRRYALSSGQPVGIEKTGQYFRIKLPVI